jgi:CRISPR/Cas system-associated exonuclease Cas4 (RecB family)
VDTFLQKLAQKVSEHSGGVSRLCVVFPNRRAGLHFKHELAKKMEGAVFPPSVFAIQDFVHSVSKQIVPENLTLVFELFNIYKKHEPHYTFERFYLWGEMILGDFDTIDKNLVDTSLLFQNIKNLKEIEQQLNFSLADLESFVAFWETFSNTEISEYREKFLRIWQILGTVYTEFKETLRRKNFAYEGMLFRSLAEDRKLPTRFKQWDKIIFAGFNILSGSEQQIIKSLLDKKAAEIYWDADTYYINDDKQEAGKFLRKNFRNLGIRKPEWVEDNLSSSPKNINIFAAPLNAGQVKALSTELLKLCNTPGFIPERTAVVLPDESLLMPVLYSLPEEIKDINITMGFSLRSAPFYSFLELLRELHKNKEVRGEKTYYYHKDITQVLLHPYIKFIGGTEIYEIVKQLSETGKLYFAPEEIYPENVHPVIKAAFRNLDNCPQVFECVLELIEGINDEIRNRNEGINPDFESEHFFHFRKSVNKLKDIFENYGEELSVNALWTLLTGVLKHVKIPFTGEPLKGLQIMGVLETRALTFDNVFILSMNEGTFPRSEPGSSFIPYNLRKSFGLPVYEDEDSGYAYNFYRLLQGAQNLYMFYNNEAGDFSTGEKSRYIAQLEFELLKINPSITVKQHTVITNTGIEPGPVITVKKTPEVLKTIENLKYLSPTGLSVYIKCPLRFYMRYVAGLKEQEEVFDIIDPARFGKIFHQVMQLMYAPHVHKELTYEDITAMYAQIEPALDEAFKMEIKDEHYIASGKNLLLKKVIHTLVCRVLDSDKKETPFMVKSVEDTIRVHKTITANGKEYKVPLFGKLDRVDLKDGVTRILDYKTGNVDAKNKMKLTTEEFFQNIFSRPGYSQTFQAYFYAYLHHTYYKNGPMRAGIYPLKKIKNGLRFVSEEVITPEEMQEFDKNLASLLGDIYNPQIPFYQTQDRDNCTFCEFKTVCGRD